MAKEKDKTPLERVQERRSVAYPPEKYSRLLIADSFINKKSKSKKLTEIVKAYYNKLDLATINILQRTYEKMSPVQRRKPQTF